MKGARQMFRVTSLLLFFLEGKMHGLRITNLIVPQHAVLGENVSLECNFDLNGGDKLYCVKWYKDGKEFFRFTPGENPPILQFLYPGVAAVLHESDRRTVVLRSVNFSSTGRYRCEISTEAPLFRTASNYSDMTVIALPENDPVITAAENERNYRIGEDARFNCTSAKSKPHALLSWFVNGDPVQRRLLKFHPVAIDRDGLETSTLGLKLELNAKHFAKGNLKIKCLARIHNVYWKTNEISVQSAKPLTIFPMVEHEEGTTALPRRRVTTNASCSTRTCFVTLTIVQLFEMLAVLCLRR